jgi:hypothetical protein
MAKYAKAGPEPEKAPVEDDPAERPLAFAY